MNHTAFVTRFVAAAFAAVALQPAMAVAADPPVRATADNAPLAAEYRLGAGDKLRIEVYKDPQLSQSLQIRPDGKITLPLVGDLDATGHTPMALRDLIATRLKEYMTNPVVTVIVVEASAATAYVIGAVNR